MPPHLSNDQRELTLDLLRLEVGGTPILLKEINMVPKHPTGLCVGPTQSECGSCAWSTPQQSKSLCVGARVDGTPVEVSPKWRGCELWEPNIPSCDRCGACCREAFDSVPVSEEDLERIEKPERWVHEHSDGWRDIHRVPSPSGRGTRCAALYGCGGDGSPFRCTIYSSRPTNCRELEIGSEACLTARRRVKLSPWHPEQKPEGPWAAATE